MTLPLYFTNRQTHRKDYPSTDFSNGVTNLTKITASERIGLVFCLSSFSIRHPNSCHLQDVREDVFRDSDSAINSQSTNDAPTSSLIPLQNVMHVITTESWHPTTGLLKGSSPFPRGCPTTIIDGSDFTAQLIHLKSASVELKDVL